MSGDRWPYARALRAGREAKGFARSKLGELLGIGKEFLAEVEHTRRGPLGSEHDAAISSELGIPVRRLEVLRALARGTVDVGGLGEVGLERVLALVAGLRAGAALGDAVDPGAIR